MGSSWLGSWHIMWDFQVIFEDIEINTLREVTHQILHVYSFSMFWKTFNVWYVSLLKLALVQTLEKCKVTPKEWCIPKIDIPFGSRQAPILGSHHSEGVWGICLFQEHLAL